MGRRRAGSILEQQSQLWSSRSPKAILLLSRDGKSKSGSQSNYCLACLLCSQPSSSEQPKETEQMEAETTSISPPSKLQFLISHWRKGTLKESTRAEPLKAQPKFGSDVPAAAMTAQGLVWDFPPQWFCFAFSQLQPWQREGLTGSFLRENLEMEGNNR